MLPLAFLDPLHLLKEIYDRPLTYPEVLFLLAIGNALHRKGLA
jgi:hypothetical protein